MGNNLEFTNPGFLWLLLLIPILGIWYFFVRKKDAASLNMASTSGFSKQNIWAKLKPVLYFLRLVAIALLIIALARPRNVEISKKTKTTRGIDIVMAIDVSASMLAKDLKPNRLEALKTVAINFVNKRPNDRIGIVVYAGESYTQTPITSDKSVVKNTISKIKWGQINDGTAIGMGLGSAVNRLKDSKAKSKVIILLTDGVNNSGFIDPSIDLIFNISVLITDNLSVYLKSLVLIDIIKSQLLINVSLTCKLDVIGFSNLKSFSLIIFFSQYNYIFNRYSCTSYITII